MAGTLLFSNAEAVTEAVLQMPGSKMARKIYRFTEERKKLREINISYSYSERNRGGGGNQLLALSPKLMYVSLYLVNNSFRAWAFLPYPTFFAHERKRNTIKKFVSVSIIFIMV